MGNLKIEYLYDIVALYNEKSIKGAAKELGISNITLKKHIEKIEVELGGKIYKDLGNNIELTDEGISFYLSAVKILSELTGYKNENLHKENKKQISIGLDVNIFPGYIYICSEKVGEKHHIQFNILQLYKENILEGVRDGYYDSGVIILDNVTKRIAEQYNLVYKEICTRRPVIMVSKKHPLAKFDEVSLRDLENYKRISLKNSFEEFYCFENDVEIKYGLKISNVKFKSISDVMVSLIDSPFYFIGGINEDEESLLHELKVIGIKELKERVEVGYIHCKAKPLLEPIKEIVEIRENIKKTRYNI